MQLRRPLSKRSAHDHDQAHAGRRTEITIGEAKRNGPGRFVLRPLPKPGLRAGLAAAHAALSAMRLPPYENVIKFFRVPPTPSASIDA